MKLDFNKTPLMNFGDTSKPTKIPQRKKSQEFITMSSIAVNPGDLMLGGKTLTLGGAPPKQELLPNIDKETNELGDLINIDTSTPIMTGKRTKKPVILESSSFTDFPETSIEDMIGIKHHTRKRR